MTVITKQQPGYIWPQEIKVHINWLILLRCFQIYRKRLYDNAPDCRTHRYQFLENIWTEAIDQLYKPREIQSTLLVHRAQVSESIYLQDLQNYFGTTFIELEGIDKSSGHPTPLGMEQINEQVKKALGL